jgi:hypothetical protein
LEGLNRQWLSANGFSAYTKKVFDLRKIGRKLAEL